MATSRPKITVVLATYNGASFVGELLSSILPQLALGDELIVSDDCSTDTTQQIIAQYKDNRIQFHSSPGFRSPIRNFEFGLTKASGQIILLADQDDVWLPNKVERMYQAIETGAQPCLAIHDLIVTDENLQPLLFSFMAHHKSNFNFWTNLVRNSFVGCAIGFNRSLLEKALPFPNGIPMHDHWLGLLATVSGKVIVLKDPLVIYRRHSKNASATAATSNLPKATKLIQRFFLVKGLLIRLTFKK